MARRPTFHRVAEFVFFDVLYEDGTQTSNRKIPGSELTASTATCSPSRISRRRTGKSLKCLDDREARSNQ